MNPIEKIKSIIEEYKSFISPRFSSSLTTSDTKRNLFQYFQAKSLGRKYGTSLYEHFGIMNDIDTYAFLINCFGKKNLENALNIPNGTTAEIGNQLFAPENIESEQSNYILGRMKNCIIFNRATGLDLMQNSGIGINPESFSRSSLKTTMIDIFRLENVTPETLKEIYDIYGDEIISSYNNDAYLRNKTVLALDEKHKESLAVGGLQDHVTYYSEDDFKRIFEKYFAGESLPKTEQSMLLGLLEKEAELISTYKVKNLKEHPEYIKSEIAVGIFDDIVVSGKKYTNAERKKLATLSKVWNKDDLDRYNNLALLKRRLEGLPQKQDVIEVIDKILTMPLDEVVTRDTEISDFMDSVFMDYEIENRQNVVDKMYEPGRGEEVVITDLSQMESAAMLHFFNPDSTMTTFDMYVADLEEQRSKELGRKFTFSKDEKEAMKLQYEVKENHYITDQALNLEAIGQVGTFDTRYVTNVSNQLCAMVVTPEDILRGNGTRGNIALGFSKSTLEPELIATISNKNIHSNKGIDYVESQNPFSDFSASYEELVSGKKRYGDNTEVVLFRNSYESLLKPSYVMYIGSSGKNRAEIEKIKGEMKEAGLDISLVIFDREAIKENMRQNQGEKSDSEVER